MQNGNYVAELPTDEEEAAQKAAMNGSPKQNGGGPTGLPNKLGLGGNVDALLDDELQVVLGHVADLAAAMLAERQV